MEHGAIDGSILFRECGKWPVGKNDGLEYRIFQLEYSAWERRESDGEKKLMVEQAQWFS